MKKLNGDLEFGTRVKLLETSRWVDGSSYNPTDVVGTVIRCEKWEDSAGRWMKVRWKEDITNAYLCADSDFEVVKNVD